MNVTVVGRGSDGSLALDLHHISLSDIPVLDEIRGRGLDSPTDDGASTVRVILRRGIKMFAVSAMRGNTHYFLVGIVTARSEEAVAELLNLKKRTYGRGYDVPQELGNGNNFTRIVIQEINPITSVKEFHEALVNADLYMIPLAPT